ncbi:hypothetical protein AADF95_004534 [Vibrio alginolyticus]
MIPEFNSSGVLPPYLDSDPTIIDKMSPYRVSLLEFVQHFATTEHRKLLLRGFLNFRLKMKSIGFQTGFQWIDGSFVEDIEKHQERDPADIDLVTFSDLPAHINSAETWDAFFSENRCVFDTDLSKKEYMCDVYYINARAHPFSIVDQTRYWFGLFSHQRDTSIWKGIIEIDFEEDESEALSFVNGGDE